MKKMKWTMMRVSVILHHARMQVVEVLRAPGYLMPIFVFPSMFFMFFAHPDVDSVQDANRFLASYVLYAILGVIFYLLLGEITDDHRSAWDDYLQTLPYGTWARLSGWYLTGVLAAIAAILTLCATAFVSTPSYLGLGQWILLLMVAIVGSAPFLLLGACIGYWVRPKFAQPIGNVIYFTLVYIGGLWTLPRGLPDWVDWLSPYAPTRMWAEMAWAVVGGDSFPVYSGLGLVAYLLLFGLIAVVGIRRHFRLRYQ